jgi:hypothetical protein
MRSSRLLNTKPQDDVILNIRYGFYLSYPLVIMIDLHAAKKNQMRMKISIHPYPNSLARMREEKKQ